MFRTSISSTPLTSDIANSVFTNITAENSYQSDVSFIATLRALVSPRMGEGDTITLRYSSSHYSIGDLNGSSENDAIDAITSGMRLERPGYFSIHYFRDNAEANSRAMELIEKGFVSRHGKFKRLDKMTAFFSKSFNVLCFLNEETKTVAIFVENMDLRRLHYLQLGILPALPWYFDPKKGVTDLEMELIHSLNERVPDKYLDCLERVAAQYDFRSVAIRNMLKGFEHQFKVREMDSVRRNISDTNSQIENYNNEIGNLFRRRNELCIKLLGLETSVAEAGDESEIMDYFLCNRKMYLESVAGAEMYFTVADYLTYFDKDVVERVLRNERSYVYTRRAGGISTAQMKKLLKAIFIDETLRMRVCAAYRFDISGNVRTMDGHDFPNNLTSTHIPNPHINRYRCMGNYQNTINRLLRDNNYVGALEQCAASCKSLNWTDSTVMEYFMGQLYRNEYACIELPDGKVVKPKDAIAWMEAQEVAKSGQKEKEE